MEFTFDDLAAICRFGDSLVNMDDDSAIELLSSLDIPEKQIVADILAEMVAGDGEVAESERELYNEILVLCGLPDPRTRVIPKGEDDDLVPAFLIVRTDGSVELHQTENLDWALTEAILCSW